MNSLEQYNIYKEQIIKMAEGPDLSKMSAQQISKMTQELFARMKSQAGSEKSWLNDVFEFLSEYFSGATDFMKENLGFLWKWLGKGTSDAAADVALWLAVKSGQEKKITEALRGGEKERSEIEYAFQGIKRAFDNFDELLGDVPKEQEAAWGPLLIVSLSIAKSPLPRVEYLLDPEMKIAPELMIERYFGKGINELKNMKSKVAPGSSGERAILSLEGDIEYFKGIINVIVSRFSRRQAEVLASQERIKKLEAEAELQKVRNKAKDQYGITNFMPMGDNIQIQIINDQKTIKRQKPKEKADEWIEGYLFVPQGKAVRSGWIQTPRWIHKSLIL